jgi:hypothetical protein
MRVINRLACYLETLQPATVTERYHPSNDKSEMYRLTSKCRSKQPVIEYIGLHVKYSTAHDESHYLLPRLGQCVVGCIESLEGLER